MLTLREVMESIGAVHAIRALDADAENYKQLAAELEEQKRQVTVLQERLTQAMERERLVTEERNAAQREVAAATRKLEEFSSHPAVRAERLDKINAQIAHLEAQAAQLKPE